MNMDGSKQSVAFLLGNLTVGGSETKIVRLANRLAGQGLDVHILAIGPPYSLREQIDASIPVHCFDRKSKFSLSILLKIKDYLREHGIDRVVCVNTYPLIYGWPAVRLLGRGSRRCIATINTSEFVSTRDKLFMPLYAFILRRCDSIVFGCRSQAATWTASYRIPADKASVIYNGVDTDYFVADTSGSLQTREELAIQDGALVIGCVAQFRPEKRQVNLLEAARRLGRLHGIDVVVILVGDGPEQTALNDFVSENQLQANVRFVGKVADVRPYLSICDVFVMPSVAVEVFSNAMLEAIAMGVPVVSTDVGGSAEMVRHEVEGFIYPRHDVDQLTDHLRRLLTDPDLAARIRANATERMKRDFTIDRMDREYGEVIWGTGRVGAWNAA